MSVSDLVGGAIGVLLSGLGIACVVASSLRGRRSDRVLLFFGTWCALYGLRLLADTPFVVETLGIPTTSAALLPRVRDLHHQRTYRHVR